MAENVAAKPYKLLIGGRWVDEKETMKVIDKYSGETIGMVPVASKKTVEQAIGAAHAAFPSYSRLPAHKRFRILEKTSQLLAKHQDEIATIICREAGKAWKYSFGEGARALARGCPPLLKPASTTPLTAIRLGEILEEAGLPPGVLNVVVGPGGTVGEWMTTDPRIAKISFPGSAPGGE